MESQQGWFFKKEHYQWLIDNGVVKATGVFVREAQSEDEQYTEEGLQYDDHSPLDLSNMTLWSYGKGWLLEPLQDDEHYGEKYFHEGWWMPKQDGWFFKNE